MKNHRIVFNSLIIIIASWVAIFGLIRLLGAHQYETGFEVLTDALIIGLMGGFINNSIKVIRKKVEGK